MLIKSKDFSMKILISNAMPTVEHKIITNTDYISPDFINLLHMSGIMGQII